MGSSIQARGARGLGHATLAFCSALAAAAAQEMMSGMEVPQKPWCLHDFGWDWMMLFPHLGHLSNPVNKYIYLFNQGLKSIWSANQATLDLPVCLPARSSMCIQGNKNSERQSLERSKNTPWGVALQGRRGMLAPELWYLVLNMLERDSLVYLSPDNFATRRSELALKKASKEISIDQTELVVRDRANDLTFSTATELDTTNAMRQRALALDLVKACRTCFFVSINGLV